MKPYELLKFTNDIEIANAAADLWHSRISETHDLGKLYCVALSGGRIAKHLFAGLTERVKQASTPLGHVHFFWADERCVSPDDPESNFSTANELLFQPLSVPPGNIHRLQGELPPGEAVSQAIVEINQHVSQLSGQPALDLVILGMGEDGHVASLFPNASEAVINSKSPFLFIDNSPKPPPKRISLSYGAIAVAHEVWVLASGKGKEAALKASLSEGNTPLAKVLGSRIKTRIFSDIGMM